MDMVNGGYQLEFVGLENYLYAFTVHGSFKQILTTSVGDMLIDVPLIIFFSLFMALMLNREFKGRTIVRAIFFLPVILNAEAIVDAIEMATMMVAGGVSASSAEKSACTGVCGSVGKTKSGRMCFMVGTSVRIKSRCRVLRLAYHGNFKTEGFIRYNTVRSMLVKIIRN